MNDGHPANVSLYDVAVGMALVSQDAREQLRNVDQLFADIHAFGEGNVGDEWRTLIQSLLGDSQHPATHDQQGDWAVGKKRFSRLYHAIIHRVQSIGGSRSLTYRQRKEASIRRALSAVMSSRSITQLTKLMPSLEQTVNSSGVPQIAAKNGSPTPGDGQQPSERRTEEDASPATELSASI
jgi:hypothetical protein